MKLPTLLTGEAALVAGSFAHHSFAVFEGWWGVSVGAIAARSCEVRPRLTSVRKPCRCFNEVAQHQD